VRFSTAAVSVLIVGALIGLAGSVAAQQAYPSKPIRLIVPYTPGGGTDTVARFVGDKLTQSWGQPVLIDNRPGGNTIIGSQALVRSPPDGYTLMLIDNAIATNPSLIAYLPYDTLKDFAPVATVTSNEMVLVVHPSVPANNLQELIALARSRPGELNYVGSIPGGPGHLASELLAMMTGIKMQYIPYKGSLPALTALIAGQVQLAFVNPLNAIQYINAGKLNAIAFTGETRLPALARVPTMTEAGLPGFEAKNWFGIFAPAGTPKEIIDKLATELARIMALPDIKEKLGSQGMQPFISTPVQFSALLKTDIARLGTLIKAGNIKIEN
jgi:tripartite-type tricarboxylate transporter receptor subunit TctC